MVEGACTRFEVFRSGDCFAVETEISPLPGRVGLR